MADIIFKQNSLHNIFATRYSRIQGTPSRPHPRKMPIKSIPKHDIIIRSSSTQVIKRLFLRRSEPTNTFRSRRLIVHTSQIHRKPSILYDTTDYCFSPQLFTTPTIRQSSCKKLDTRSQNNTHSSNYITHGWENAKPQKFIDIYQTLILQRNMRANNAKICTNENTQFESILKVRKVDNTKEKYISKYDGNPPKYNLITKKNILAQKQALDNILCDFKNKNNEVKAKLFEAQLDQEIKNAQARKEISTPILVRSQSTKGRVMPINQMQQKFFEQTELTPWD